MIEISITTTASSEHDQHLVASYDDKDVAWIDLVDGVVVSVVSHGGRIGDLALRALEIALAHSDRGGST